MSPLTTMTRIVTVQSTRMLQRIVNIETPDRNFSIQHLPVEEISCPKSPKLFDPTLIKQSLDQLGKLNNKKIKLTEKCKLKLALRQFQATKLDLSPFTENHVLTTESLIYLLMALPESKTFLKKAQNLFETLNTLFSKKLSFLLQLATKFPTHLLNAPFVRTSNQYSGINSHHVFDPGIQLFLSFFFLFTFFVDLPAC